MPDLKLIAFDADDLAVVSAHLQDAVVRLADVTFLPREKRFVALLNRFDWQAALGAGANQSAEAPGPSKSQNKPKFERRRSGLRFERVLAAQVQNIDVKDRKATLALLAVTFTPTVDNTPEGDVTLTFSGGAAIRLKVECLEAELKDLGAVWTARHAPDHPDEPT